MKLFPCFPLRTVLLILFIQFVHFSIVRADVPDTRVGGYIQLYGLYQYEEDVAPHEENWGYRLRRARLTVQSDITDRLSATSWLEFAGRQNILLDFHFDYRLHTALRVRGGQFRPHGQTFNTGILGSASLIFVERAPITTFNASTMGFDAFRDIGVMAYGNYERLYYALHATNGNGRFTQAGAQINSRSFGSGSYGGRVDFRPLNSLLIGGHISLNRQRDLILDNQPPVDVNRYSGSIRLLTDGLLTDRSFSQTEFVLGSRDDSQEFTYDGIYSQLGYRFRENLSVMGRFDYLAQRYDDQSDDIRYGVSLAVLRYIFRNSREAVRAGINYNLTELPQDSHRHTVTAVFQVRFFP